MAAQESKINGLVEVLGGPIVSKKLEGIEEWMTIMIHCRVSSHVSQNSSTQLGKTIEQSLMTQPKMSRNQTILKSSPKTSRLEWNDCIVTASRMRTSYHLLQSAFLNLENKVMFMEDLSGHQQADLVQARPFPDD